MVLILLLWVPQAFYQLSTWVYWLQIKEYRFDRFWVFLKSMEGRNSLGIIWIVAKIIAIFLSSYTFTLSIVIFSFLDFLVLKRLLDKNIRFPEITQRVKKIFITSFLGITMVFVLDLFWKINGFLFGEILLVTAPVVGILWTTLLVKKAKELEILKSKEKLTKYKPTVIGITGSFGKTTTKDFVFQILSCKYKCLPTLKNQNTHFGILRRINSDLKKEHKFFIAEVGAYKRGEIEEIAKVLKPKSVFITGIEPQHLELFGSFDNLKKAKFELVESLEKGGLTLFNVTGNDIYDLVKWTEKLKKDIKIIKYSVGKNSLSDVFSKIDKVGLDGITFTIFAEGASNKIKTNIISKGLIENLTGAILIARFYGVSWKDIVEACENLVLPDSTLNVFKTKMGITVIDDSYNSSPSGFKEALETLKTIEGKRKIVVTTGIIELGKEMYQTHKKIGNSLKGISDLVILRNKDFFSPIKDGIGDSDKLMLINDPKKIVSYLSSSLKIGDVVLIEGKNPLVLKYLKSI